VGSEILPQSDEPLVAWAPQPGPQVALLSCPVEDLLFGGARGGGKTDGLLGDWLSHWNRYQNLARGMIVRRSYDELDEIKARLDEIMPMAGAYFRASKNTWVMPGGNSASGALKLRYLAKDKDADRYQGHSYTWIGADEAGNFPTPEPIDKLRATLRSKFGVPTKLRLTGNPGGPGQGWLYERYIKPAPPMTVHIDPTTQTRRVFIPSKLSDNRMLVENDPDYSRRLRSSGPAWLVQAWLEGDWTASPEGGIIKSRWFLRWDERPIVVKSTVQSWDTAYKAQQHNDPSVCTTWQSNNTGHYLVDQWRDRVTYPDLKRAVINAAEKWNPDAILIEDKASGQSLIQELRSTTRLPIVAIEPEGDKITRALAVSMLFEAGLVWFPRHAPWILDYEIELTTFPQAPHDDRVDSTTQFLQWIKQRSFVIDFASSKRGREAEEDRFDTDTGFGRIPSNNRPRGY